jgi:hypothetical protein
MTVLGGVGTLWGGVLGAAVFVMLRDFLSTSDLLCDAPGVVTEVVFIVIEPELYAAMRRAGIDPNKASDVAIVKRNARGRARRDMAGSLRTIGEKIAQSDIPKRAQTTVRRPRTTVRRGHLLAKGVRERAEQRRG